MRGIIWGYIYTLSIKIHIKDNTWNVIIFTTIQETLAKFGGRGLLRKEYIV